MIKRITTVSLVLLINITLLASIVIPHHHHESEVCIVNTHCHSDDSSHESDKASHEHEADNSGQCTLLNSFIIPMGNDKQDIYKLIISCNYSTIDLVEAYYPINHSTESQSYLITHPPDIVSLYNSIIINSKGLRAPPVI